MRALLVEDSFIFAAALRLLLDEAGKTDVELVHIGRLAEVEAQGDLKPEVVLLDLSLPDADGIESLRGVQEALPGLPIVVLTGEDDQQIALRMMREGAQDYLVKRRFDADTLVRAMRYAIERAQSAKLRNQLVQADRLAAVGRLAAGVAHEISNPATFVQAGLGIEQEHLQQAEASLRRALELTESLPDHAGLLEELQGALRALVEGARMAHQNTTGVQRICDIVQDLRGYSRLETSDVVPVDPVKVVTDVCGFAASVVRHKARLVRLLDPVPPVGLPSGRLDQILTNLLVNAAQAIPESAADRNTVTVSTYVADEDVVIAVEDTGPGMSPEQKSRVFDPFFTTKPRGVGTGLGLSICLELARAHRGDITCTSEVAKGTRFEVRFPPIRQDSIPPVPSLPPETAAYRARVLLIDDEPNIRQVYSILLSDDFEVEVAASGQQGLEKMEANPDYDVVVCDVMMPDMDAAELIDAIGTRHPDLLNRFVLYTGGAVTEHARSLVDSGRFRILYKPLPADELKAAIREKVAENTIAQR